MKDYIILVITYNRVERCYKKTLSMLKDNKIPKDIINLVVHNAEQKRLYEEGIPKEYYNEILITNKKDGIYGQMNWMYNKYKNGQKILKLDDDISTILRLQGDKLVKTYDLLKIIDEGFKLCDDNGYKLWGIYPTANAYFMKSQKDYTTDLRFIVGALMGFINEKLSIDLDIKIKGDYEYAIKSYLKNGGMIRFNRITFRYDIAKNEGDRIKVMINDANILMKKYPNLVKMNTRRNNEKNMGEILLNKSEKDIEGGKITSLKNIPVDDYESTDVIMDNIEQTKTIKDLQEKLYNELENAKIPRIEGARKDNRKTRGDLIGYKGWTFNMGIGRRRNLGLSEFSANKKEPELLKTVIEYGNKILPTGFKYNVITVNKNLKAKKHIDGGNSGFGAITFIGDFTGGGLYIYDKYDKPTLYDTHNKLIIFNGANLAHRTEPFKKNRYAIIYYTQVKDAKIKGFKTEGEGIN
jgi:hypothetical protein